MEDRDLINLSVPLPLLKKAHKLVTDRVKEIDALLLKGLEAAGFELELGRTVLGGRSSTGNGAAGIISMRAVPI